MSELAHLAFFVAGHPTTQGSKRAFVVNGRPILTEQSGDKLRLWRHAISDGARAARGDGPIWEGPVDVLLWFHLLKPASEPKVKRTWPIKKRSGDVDKLARAALDALSGVVFLDDCQVTKLSVWKEWAGPPGPGVAIRVSPVSTSEALHSVGSAPVWSREPGAEPTNQAAS